MPADAYRRIYVFGSNLAGRHGKGSALIARRLHGACYGQGEGLQGRSYGIPTKDRFIRTMPLQAIEPGVHRFIEFARAHPQWEFEVMDIGCLNAGYRPEQVAPMFAAAPQNCFFSDAFAAVLRDQGVDCRTWAELAAPAPAPQRSLF